MNKNRVITRRDFIRGTVYTTIATSMGLGLPSEKEVRAEGKVKVVLIRDQKVIDQQGRINPDILQNMLDQGVTSLVEDGNSLQAWKRLIKPTDIVGIKSNAWNPLPTPKELEAAIERANEMAVEVTNSALQIFGGYGYSREYPMEWLVRFARGWTIAGGTAQIQRNNIARELLKGRDSRP